jgi:hypothetical protein
VGIVKWRRGKKFRKSRVSESQVMEGKMAEYPVNVKQCEHPGCEDTGTTPCVVTTYAADYREWREWWSLLATYGVIQGLRILWELWREGWADLPPEYYCAEHAKEHGFCWGCGQFWSGCERFDFEEGIFCPNCKETFEGENYENEAFWDDRPWVDGYDEDEKWPELYEGCPGES